MKLIECHISGFGSFKNYKLSFDDGLNVILQPNGWGKTTLTAFIKAMLYGFERKRVRDVNENERLRYKPWDGGKYGGTLDFEFEGREYRVLREFGATASGDTLKVIDIETGKPVQFNGDEVGDWVFGLDSNAFQKSVFVGQNGFGFDGSTAGLRNRLNALVNEADDVAGLDKAQTALDARRKHYKKTGNRGYIADVSSSMAKLVERQKTFDSQIAQMGMLQERMSQLDSSITDAASRETELQKKIEAAQSGEIDIAALTAAREQLVERKKAADEAYRAYVSQVGKIPAEADLETARKAVESAHRCREEIAGCQEAIDAAQAAKAEIAAKYAGIVPSKTDIDSRREQLAELAHQLELIGLSDSSATSSYSELDATIESDPELLTRAEAAISGWGEIEAGIKSAHLTRREIDAANAVWAERRANIAKMKEEADQAESLVPSDVESLISNYRKTATVLREAEKSMQASKARMEGLKSQISDMEAELGAWSNQAQADENDLRRIDDGVASCKAASSCLASAKQAASAEESKLNGLKAAREIALEKSQAAKSAVAEAEVEKAKALSDDLSAKAALAEAERSKSGNPAPAIVCIALGIIAAIAGFVFGPDSTISYAAYAIGGVAVIFGIVLFARKPSGNSEALTNAESTAKTAAEKLAGAERRIAEANKAKSEADEEATKTNAEFEAQVAASDEASKALKAAEKEDLAARATLVELLSSLAPFESFDADAVVVQVPALKNKLAEHSKRSLRLAELKDEIESLDSNRREMEASAAQAVQSLQLEFSEDLSAIADSAVAKAAELESAISKADTAQARLKDAIADVVGKPAGQIASAEINNVLASLNCETCPGMEDREKAASAAEKAGDKFVAALKPLLSAFSIEVGDDPAIAVERLSFSVAAYRKYKEDVARTAAETAESRKVATSIEEGLDAWAKTFGLAGREALTASVLDAMATDASSVEKLEWDIKKTSEKAATASTNHEKQAEEINQFLQQYGMSSYQSAQEAIEEAARRAKRCDELANEFVVADEQLSAWEAKFGLKLEEAKRGADNAQTAQMKAILSAVQNEREGQVAELAQAEEKRNAILLGLEGYLACAQEIRLLSQKKQEATAKLFTIQKTAEFLSKARTNLDGRYLGGLTNRFNDYASSWLGDEGFDVVVGGDFDVAVSDGTAPHSVASYSTGYQDLLDICLRMALVDTVFEAEEPFIVMDDPFVNLDQEKIGRAMLLLALLAQKKQIIYFTCHPSRMEDGADAPAAKFTLPEQKASREMPRARAKREAEERARAQAELVASYHVEPVTQGRAAIRVADSSRTVTNNMFNVRFEIDPDSGRRDNAFDVHFIDEKGRALCERQIIEVIDGRVVPERIRFCLTTRDDSGKAFDLIVHEQEKPEATLAARIAYKADISFNTEDFAF